MGGCGAYASRECVFHIVVPFDWATGKATPVNTMAFGVSQFLRQNRGHTLRLLHEHCFFLGGGGGTRPWWLALLACEAAYWPLALEPSVLTFVRGGGCVGGGIREKGKGVLGGVGQGGGGRSCVGQRGRPKPPPPGPANTGRSSRGRCYPDEAEVPLPDQVPQLTPRLSGSFSTGWCPL